MCTIIKASSILIKCSNPPKNEIESMTCMAVESNTKSFPIHMIWIYANKFMPSLELQSTLSDALNHFSILAGRITEDLNGNATIHLNNEGVLFTEAQCQDQTLDYFINRTTDDDELDYNNINSADLEVPASRDWTGPMMSIQITRLQCGSVILSISAFHCLMDAQSAAYFINTWASGGNTPKHHPMFDKSFVLLSSDELLNNSITRPSDCVFNRNVTPSSTSAFIQVQQQRVITKVYHFSTNELKNIKAEAMKNLSSTVDYISTYDALYAHMILTIASATQTSFTEENKIKILQSFNGRSSFVGSYSSAVLHYFGSFPFWLYSKVITQEPPTLSSLAQLIHEMYTKQTEKSLKYYNAYLSSDDGNIRKNQVDADIINRDFHCTSWRKVHMLDASFGSTDNYPIYSGPTKQQYPRYFVMMDTHRRDESVNILLGLREQDYQRSLEQNIIHKYR
ncbi:unnamed protein product [Adineta steineri]|uniref:Uncharacterized protein n=1 Tax=Adineta steineri TaxID=433720 RepID=A0A819GTD8_9BILA|nr:unnamed protein product [Adineta steineri]